MLDQYWVNWIYTGFLIIILVRAWDPLYETHHHSVPNNNPAMGAYLQTSLAIGSVMSIDHLVLSMGTHYPITIKQFLVLGLDQYWGPINFISLLDILKLHKTV